MAGPRLTPRRYLANELAVLGAIRRKVDALPRSSCERAVLAAWAMAVRQHVRRLQQLVGPEAAEMCAPEHFQGGNLL